MKSISLEELHDTLKNQSSARKKEDVILDVRTPEEFAEGHLIGAINIPVDEINTRFNELKKTGTIYLYCKAGRRAAYATHILQEHGFQNLACVDEGGFPDWQAMGFPFEA